jgi:DNA-directed RNA polymerase subunit beta
VLLKALGWTSEQIMERFGFSEIMMSTLEKDNTAGSDEAAGHLPQAAPGRAADQSRRRPCWRTWRSATTWLALAAKVNKLGLNANAPITSSTLTPEDIATCISTWCVCTRVRPR